MRQPSGDKQETIPRRLPPFLLMVRSMEVGSFPDRTYQHWSLPMRIHLIVIAPLQRRDVIIKSRETIFFDLLHYTSGIDLNTLSHLRLDDFVQSNLRFVFFTICKINDRTVKTNLSLYQATRSLRKEREPTRHWYQSCNSSSDSSGSCNS